MLHSNCVLEGGTDMASQDVDNISLESRKSQDLAGSGHCTSFQSEKHQKESTNTTASEVSTSMLVI